MGQSSLIVKQIQQETDLSPIAVLGASLVVLLVFIITICKRKNGMSFSGSISLTDGTQQDKPQDGRQDALHNHLPLLQNNHLNTMGNQTDDRYLNDKYMQSYSTDGSNSVLIFGVYSFKDFENVRCDRSMEEQLDNLKLQAMSEGNQTNTQSNKRTLRRIPTESEDENSMAMIPISDSEKEDEHCNNVSKRFITSGNTDVNEHFRFAYKQNIMHSCIQQGSVDGNL
ncbi:Hypothetical predicted protein [Mytilus galloprovincialis]|uniref:Uncharacterized protein n=1 Tax=Mytilus galloprovincialis TaxID=29158 RepID=A0A8B6GW15_MYTGA|nr:Hypothetical predicted protein [Mytilus galloprovincialis]